MMKGKKKNVRRKEQRNRLRRRVGHMIRTQDERRTRQRLPKLVSPTVSVSSSSSSNASTISRSTRNRTPPRTSQSWGGSEKRRRRKEALARCIHESNAIKTRLMGNARRFLMDDDEDEDRFVLPPISRSR